MNKQTVAITQLSYIISKMDPKIKHKIPFEVRKAISQKKDNSIIFYYDESKPLYKQNILNETKSILSVLYSKYICSESEKKKWEEFDRAKIEIIHQKYKADNIFNTNNKYEETKKINIQKQNENLEQITSTTDENTSTSKEVSLIKINEKSIIYKIKQFIKNILKK